jgi:type VI secretion system protein ImpL
LYSAQQRVPLRGLMFSLASALPADGQSVESAISSVHKQAMTLPASWQGVIDDCTRVCGRRVGMAWEQTLAWVMIAALVSGGGNAALLALNYSQISSVAIKP